MSTSTNSPWDYATPAKPKTELWWTLAVIAVIILGIALWGPTTAILPPMLGSLVVGVGMAATLITLGFAFTEADGIGFLVAVACAAIGIGMPIIWQITATHKQNVPISARAIEKLAQQHGGRIAFSSGYVYGATRRASSYVADGGGFSAINKYGRHLPIKSPHVRDWGVKNFESQILDKQFSPANQATIASGKMVCQVIDADTLCAQRRANGQYYTGTYIIRTNKE